MTPPLRQHLQGRTPSLEVLPGAVAVVMALPRGRRAGARAEAGAAAMREDAAKAAPAKREVELPAGKKAGGAAVVAARAKLQAAAGTEAKATAGREAEVAAGTEAEAAAGTEAEAAVGIEAEPAAGTEVELVVGEAGVRAGEDPGAQVDAGAGLDARA